MVLLGTHEKAFFCFSRVCPNTNVLSRVYIYNKEKNGFETRKVFMNVKFEGKMQLSSQKIWWNGK